VTCLFRLSTPSQGASDFLKCGQTTPSEPPDEPSARRPLRMTIFSTFPAEPTRKGRPQPIICDYLIYSHAPLIPHPFTFTGRHGDIHEVNFRRPAEYCHTISMIQNPSLICTGLWILYGKVMVFFLRGSVCYRVQDKDGWVLALKDCLVDGNSLQDETIYSH